jgi:transcriptional regulator with XRE-family HTH domain
MHPLKIFLSIPLTDPRENSRKYLFFLSKLVEDVAKRSGFTVYQARKSTDPIKHPDVPSSLVHFLDRKELMTSDLVLLYAGKPSLGVGDEYEIAAQAGIPVVILIEKGKKLSRMINGGFARKIKIVQFTEPEDLNESLNELFKELKPRLLRRKSSLKVKTNLQTIKKRITETRVLRGFSREHLSDLVGISADYLKTIETCPEFANPSFIVLCRIAQALEVPVSYLIDPDITEELLLSQESKKALSEFAREYNLQYTDYEELLIYARRGPTKKPIRKEEWCRLYERIKERGK